MLNLVMFYPELVIIYILFPSVIPLMCYKPLNKPIHRLKYRHTKQHSSRLALCFCCNCTLFLVGKYDRTDPLPPPEACPNTRIDVACNVYTMI